MTQLDLLYEVTRGKSPPLPHFDRWFRNRRFDLSVYGTLIEPNGQAEHLLRVQWFRLDHRERLKSVSLFWNGQKLQAYLIDEGDADIRKNNSPMLIASLTPDLQRLIEEFEKVSTNVPAELREFVLEKLRKSPLSGND